MRVSMIKRLSIVWLSLLLIVAGLPSLTNGQEQARTPIRIWSGSQATTAMSRVPAAPVYPVQRGLRVGTILRSARVFRIAGGVMFDSMAVACPSMSSKKLKLSYDASRANGDRLVLQVDGSSYSVPGVYDYELRPIADFVQDDRPVLVNMLGDYPGEKPDCERPPGLYVISLHPAFLDTKSGWPLVRADMLPSSLESGTQWHTGEVNPVSTGALGREIEEARLEDLEEYLGNTTSQEERNYTTNINDAAAPPEFCIGGGVVSFKGLPSVVYPAQLGDSAYNLPKSTRVMTGKTAVLRDIDPEAYDAMIHVYHVGALFRYVKQSSLVDWRRFIRTLPRKVVVQTPRLACPGCYPGEVQEWLDECVAPASPNPARGRRMR